MSVAFTTTVLHPSCLTLSPSFVNAATSHTPPPTRLLIFYSGSFEETPYFTGVEKHFDTYAYAPDIY
jgi:hypothetical protein